MRWLGMVLAVLCLQSPLMAMPSVTPAPVAANEAPLRVFNRTVLVFRGEFLGASPQMRTQRARTRAEVLSMLHANIQDVFNRYGVQIMSPHYMNDTDTAKVVPPEAWYAAPATPPGKDDGQGRG